MKIIIRSKLGAEKVETIDGMKMICISITSTGDRQAAIKCTDMILRLVFDDLSEKPWHQDIWGNQTDKYDHLVLFNEEHAKLIARFMESHCDADICLIHCDAGLSRSPAVGIAIDEHPSFTGMRSQKYKLYPCYNRFVYHTLRQVLHETMV